jgi:nitroreductase/dihydropteridine reductase
MMNIYNKYIKYKTKYFLTKKKGSFIKNLIWRRAEKHFLPGAVDISMIRSAIINAPSSYGIQPFHVLVITNQIVKQDLKQACYNQAQIEESYCLFIFCAINNIEKRIDEYVNQSGYDKKRESMIKYVNNLPSKIEWSKRQAYIALGFGMAAAMELNIASCPMEGFSPEEISKVLNLDTNLVPCVLLTVGIKDNNYTLEKRFRFEDDDIFTNII